MREKSLLLRSREDRRRDCWLWGDVDTAVMLLLLEIESRMRGLGGVPPFRLIQGRFEAEKGHRKELRVACLLFVVHVL